jgi:hypothetical protein
MVGTMRGTRVPRAALALAGVVGLGLTAGAGCSDSAPGGQGGAAVEGAVTEGKQALTSAPVCLSIRRQGAAGTVFDAGIVNKTPPKNYATSQTMSLGPAAGYDSQVLLQFDLSAIPSGSSTNITTATVNLARGVVAPSGPGTLEVHRALAPWSEATVTWQSFAGAFDPLSAATFSNQPTFPSFGLQALVQGWVRGTVPNYGVLIKDPGAAVTNLWTSEYGNFYSRPELYVCYTITCAPDFADCNGNGADGCETNLVTSAASCGACGNACNVANAAPACVGGACQVASCNLGFGDCDGSAANGCETLLTTTADCGGCGVPCARAHGSASCATGTCALTGCSAGFFDCDGNPANGCEALPCGNNGHCTTGAQCASAVCQGGFCATPACNDGVKNGAETGTDCGGGACPLCATGGGCAGNADCGSAVCQGGICQAASCSDGVKNGAETGTDCGGPCPLCAAGGGCVLGTDCASGVCQGGVCQAVSCNDSLKNGAETAIDCGGGVCPACPSGKTCNVGADCVDLVCQGHVCQLANCNDGVKNGAEADVDCGGPCVPCNAQAHCGSGADCVSGVCQGGICQTPTCSDGVKNGNETGTDCGGSCYVAETCDGVDNDCNGLIDDGLGSTTCGVGACQVTVQNCVGGVTQSCTPLPAHAEECDGLVDDDCDGVVDNGCDCVDGHTQSCYTAAPATLGVGVCQSGVQTCVLGKWAACVGEVTPAVETCDGLDNDCNGQADDGLGQTVCGIGACQVATPNCLNGLPQACTPRGPGVETCDGTDEDCDGIVDNNLPTITCGVGACQVTVDSCLNGALQTCTPGTPSAETCDGVDNDCNGLADDGNPGGGQACNTGKLGVCAAGTTVCTNGGIVCQQNVQPSAETCDGLDNDCDGVIDNGNPGSGAACSTGKPGICAAGTTVCSGGGLSCQQNAQPHAETCNGLDDDCDGAVDNGNPGGGQSCGTGLLGVCAAGTTVCAGGSVSCQQNVQPSAEVCDGLLDQNCNGQVDEGCACVTGTNQACYSGAAGTAGVGLCHAGTQTCVNGQWGACTGQVLPTAETCDGLDNNCNGQVDDGLGTISCGVGACARTVAACAGGHANTCTPGAPSAEVCDGVDNNCDGQIDEGNPGGNAACSTGKPGICAAGTTACIAGALACNQTKQATTETCNGLDDNCNGTVDDGAAATCPGVANGTAACTAGACTVGTCTTGFKNCDGLSSDGCEVNSTSDVNNCGACGAVCALANALSTCTGSACAVSACTSGFGNCDGVASNGCEADLGNSAANCGTCGHACAGGQSCYAGACSSTCSGNVALTFPYVAGCTNVAPGKTYAVTGAYGGTTGASAADANTCTAWNSGGFAPATWQVDLGASTGNLRGVTVIPNMQPNGSVGHVVETSPDGTTWTARVTISQAMSNGVVYSFDFGTYVTARYVRVRSTSSPSWIAWTEIAVFKC